MVGIIQQHNKHINIRLEYLLKNATKEFQLSNLNRLSFS